METVIKVSLLWIICFYISIIIASLIKGVRLSFLSVAACIISPIVFVKVNSDIVKMFFSFLYTDKNLTVTKLTMMKIKTKLAFFMFPEFLNFYFEFIDSMQKENDKE